MAAVAHIKQDKQYIYNANAELKAMYTGYGHSWNDFYETFHRSHEVPNTGKLQTLSGLRSSKKGVALPVSSTGFVEGDVLVDGDGGIVRMHYMAEFGADNHPVMIEQRVRKEDTPRFNGKHVFSPSMGTVRGLLRPPIDAIRQRFLEKIQYVYPYRGLSEDNIVQRLSEWADDRANHRNIGAGDLRWRVEVIALPQTIVNAIDDDRVVNWVINKRRPWFYIGDLVSLGTNAQRTRKPVLFARRSVWKVSNVVIDQNFNGLVIPLEQTRGHKYLFVDLPSKMKHIVKKNRRVQNEKIEVVESSGALAIMATASTGTPRNVHEWLRHLGLPPLALSDFPDPTISHLKSAVQKLIRLRPAQLFWNNTNYDARSFLVYCCFHILHGSSQFLPHLQVSVRGPTNLAKRLAVISVEDSDHRVLENREDCSTTSELLAAAFLSMRVVEWFPSDALVEKWFRTALALRASVWACVYHTKYPTPVLKLSQLHHEQHGMVRAAYFIRYLTRSFVGDMNMIEDIAHRSGGKRNTMHAIQYVSQPQPPITMPWIHIFDQHIDPTMAYLMPSPKKLHEFVRNDLKREIYWNVLQFLFRYCTGINSRRQVWDRQHNGVRIARIAQGIYSRLLHPPPLEPLPSIEARGKLTESIPFSFTMSREWIAGAVGVQRFGKVTFEGTDYSMVWTLNPKEMHTNAIVATPEPVVRDMDPLMASTAMSNETIQSTVRDGASIALRNGTVRMRAIPGQYLPRPELYNAHLRQNADGSYDVKPENTSEWIPFQSLSTWKENFQRRDNCQYTSYNQVNIDKCLRTPYHGIAPVSAIQEFIRNVEAPVIRRMLPYLRHHRPYFDMNRVSRSGGTKMGSETVHRRDRNVFRALLVLSEMVPYALCPTPGRPFRFTVTHTMLLKYVRGLFEQELIEKTRKKTVRHTKQWAGLHDSWPLVPFQRKIVEEMKAGRARGKSSFFLNCKVGTGKTLMALQFIRESMLHEVDAIYFITPFSAFAQVAREMDEQGFRVNICTSTRNEQRVAGNEPSWNEFRKISSRIRVDTLDTFEPQAGTITLVKHLGLYHLEKLTKRVSNAVVVCDEVHKMMRESKKASMAKTLCRNSKFLICLTGTPILEVGYAKYMISWLEPMCDFYINVKNIVVGFNAMHSYKAELGIVEEVETIDMPLGDQLEPHNRYLESGDLMNAYKLCHDVVFKEMVRQTAKWHGSEGVFLVARDRNHQERLAKAVSAIPGARVMVYGTGFADVGTATPRISVHLTRDSVRREREDDFNVVVVRMAQCEGYTVTKLGVRVTSVYFSNQASREQIQGRLMRLSQHRKKVRCIEVMTGILNNVKQKYNTAALHSACVQGKKISKKELRNLGIRATRKISTDGRGQPTKKRKAPE